MHKSSSMQCRKGCCIWQRLGKRKLARIRTRNLPSRIFFHCSRTFLTGFRSPPGSLTWLGPLDLSAAAIATFSAADKHNQSLYNSERVGVHDFTYNPTLLGPSYIAYFNQAALTSKLAGFFESLPSCEAQIRDFADCNGGSSEAKIF